MTQSNRMVRGELGGRGARNRGRSVQGSPVGSVSVASELGSHLLRTSRGFGGCQAQGPQGDWARSPFLRSSQSEGELGTESCPPSSRRRPDPIARKVTVLGGGASKAGGLAGRSAVPVAAGGAEGAHLHEGQPGEGAARSSRPAPFLPGAAAARGPCRPRAPRADAHLRPSACEGKCGVKGVRISPRPAVHRLAGSGQPLAGHCSKGRARAVLPAAWPPLSRAAGLPPSAGACTVRCPGPEASGAGAAPHHRRLGPPAVGRRPRTARPPQSHEPAPYNESLPTLRP